MSFSLRAAGMDRPSTIMLCRVVPGIGFKVIRVFSASATNSGSFSVFRKAASTARHAIARHAGRHGVRDARNQPLNTKLSLKAR